MAAIALLTFGGQLGISQLISPLPPITTKIHAVSEQAIRAQTISNLATNLANAKRPGLLYTYRTQLAGELNEFIAVHRGMVLGDASRRLTPPASAEMEDLMLNPSSGLDRFARDFEDRVRRDFLGDALTVEDGLAQALQENIQMELSPRLREVTALLSQDARVAVTKIYTAQAFLSALAILLMLVLGNFLYRPLAKKIALIVQRDLKDTDRNLLRFDEVTGLANRTYLLSFMSDLCKFSRQHDFKSAILNLEVNNIEAVRTALEAQDINEMMSMIARRIESVCRSGDFVARVNESEFIVVITSFEDDNALNDMTNALRTKLSLPFVLATQSFSLTTKIGIKIANKKDRVPTTILNQAATALKIAKASDNYDIQFFSDSLAPKANQREQEFIKIENGLKNAQFCAHFQPIIDLQSGDTLGLEALVRWNHPNRGILSPIHFMETVKNRDLSNDLTRAVLGDALKAFREWQSQNIFIPYISVNLNLEQLEDRTFIDELKWIADSYDQPPETIAFEFPEAVFVPSSGTGISENLKRLSDYGFRIIMDDFGSLGLKIESVTTVPLEHVKIDRAFITNLDSETLQQAATLEMIKQAQDNKISVVAEGVETPAERAILSRMEADAFQGYLICEPLDAEMMTQWLTSATDSSANLRQV